MNTEMQSEHNLGEYYDDGYHPEFGYPDRVGVYSEENVPYVFISQFEWITRAQLAISKLKQDNETDWEELATYLYMLYVIYDDETGNDHFGSFEYHPEDAVQDQFDINQLNINHLQMIIAINGYTLNANPDKKDAKPKESTWRKLIDYIALVSVSLLFVAELPIYSMIFSMYAIKEKCKNTIKV